MLKIFIHGACARVVNVISFIMSKNNEKVYYAVGRGREIGIFDSWKECKVQIDGIANAKFRKFFSIEEAEEFVSFWKNYSSPSKSTVDSSNSVSSHMNGGGQVQSARRKTSLEIDGEMSSESFTSSPHLLSNGKGFVLGHNEEERRNRGRERKSYSTTYISPISNNYFNSTLFRNRKSNGKKGKAEEGTGTVECGRAERKNSSEQKFSFDDISTPKTDFQFSIPGPFTSDLISGTVFPKSDSSSVSEDIVKKEMVEMENDSEDESGSKEFLDVSDKLAKCLSLLESALKIVTNQNEKKSATVRNRLKALAQRILSDTNDGVNPQMDGGDESAHKCQESGNNDSGPSVEVQAEETPTPPRQQHNQHQSPCKISESPSSHLSSSFDGRVDQKNVDILALNLRLDSFEKRFDACLKEVGAIVSEMSHIKSEIKELKESMTSGSGSSYSPRKSKGGLTQTTLNFGTRSPGSSGGTFASRCYSSGEGNLDSGEPEAKRGRSLKRKLSKSDSSENWKRPSDSGGGTDEILSRIKMETVDYTSFTLDAEDYVEVYTDGACHSNGKNEARAGIGIWFGNSHPLNVAEPVDGPPTNNSAEIQAARVAIELAINAGVSKLKIHTDSEFLINCVTKWMHRWKKNGWTLVNGGQVKNRKELEKLDKVASKISVRWEKVQAHSGIHGNEMADRLANEGAAKYKR